MQKLNIIFYVFSLIFALLSLGLWIFSWIRARNEAREIISRFYALVCYAIFASFGALASFCRLLREPTWGEFVIFALILPGTLIAIGWSVKRHPIYKRLRNQPPSK